MIPKNRFSYLSATAAILDIESYQNRQQFNLWTVMMCLCENNQIESWQIQMGENETLRFICLHMVHTIACVMLKQQFFEIEMNTHNFYNNTLSFLKGSLISI